MNAREREVREIVAKALEADGRGAVAFSVRAGCGTYDVTVAVRAMLPLVEQTDRMKEALEACVVYARLVNDEWRSGTLPPATNSAAGRVVAIGRAELAAREAAKPKFVVWDSRGASQWNVSRDGSGGELLAVFCGPNAREHAEAHAARLNAEAK